MNTTVINVRTRTDVKKAAQDVARDLGLSLSALINGFLNQLVKTKSIDLQVTEKPTKYLLQILKEAQEEIRRGEVSPVFNNDDDAIAWLQDKDREYENQISKKVR